MNLGRTGLLNQMKMEIPLKEIVKQAIKKAKKTTPFAVTLVGVIATPELITVVLDADKIPIDYNWSEYEQSLAVTISLITKKPVLVEGLEPPHI